TTQTVTSAGINNPTFINPGAFVTIPNGQTYGFFVSVVINGTGTGDIEYTNGAFNFSDAYLTLDLGMGSGTSTPGLGNTFIPRSWNGTVYYSVGGAGSAENFFDLAIDKSGATATSLVDLDIDNNLDVISGTFDLNDNDADVFNTVTLDDSFMGGNGTINVRNDWTDNGGVFVPEGGTVIFDRSTNSSVTGTGGSGPPQMMGIPPQQGTYSGNVRVYYFNAPIDFTITGLRIPDDQPGNQTIEIIRFNSGPAPEYPTITNDFVQLGRWVNIPGTAQIPCNIAVTSGEWIGILGYRGTTNSYGSAPYNTSIDGNPVTLTRMGMQYYLTTTAAQDVWQQSASNNIGRIEMYYSIGGGPSMAMFNNVIVDKTNPPLDKTGFGCDVTVNSDFTVTTGSALINAPYHVSVNGSTNLNAGTECFEIRANNTGYSSFIDNGIAGTGTTRVQSYIVEDEWHYVTPPISNAVSGTFYQMYLKAWNENNYTWGDYITPVNVPLNVGEGYSVWSYGTGPGSKTVLYTDGILNTGDIVLPVTATDASTSGTIDDGEGWNFVGNPYPSVLDWNGSWAATNISPIAYFWPGAPGPTSNYMTWNWATGLGTNGKTNGEVAPAQGFFVKATDFNPALTAPQNQRMHSYEPFYENQVVHTNLLRLLAIGNSHRDEALVYFNQGATSGYDVDYDNYKLQGINAAPQLYSIGEDFNFAVNTLPAVTKGLIVPLGFEVGEAGKYKIWASGFDSFDNEIAIYLEDLKEDKMIPIYQNPTYEFHADPNDEPARFLLHFGLTEETKEAEADITLTENNISIYAYEKDVYVNFTWDTDATVVVYDMLGHEIYNEELNGGGLHKISLLDANGYYVVKAFTTGKVVTEKVFIE
ncbi:MAG: T9SS type A sorting domain-containing protein, partial [Bacteroidales bacterium]|nr:T9SS type A sorting domain-containing protein [Bacteroidales bacterium]